MEKQTMQEQFNRYNARLDEVRTEATALRQKLDALAAIHESGACCAAQTAKEG